MNDSGGKRQTLADLGEVVGKHALAGAAVDSRLATEDLGAERLWEATDRLSEVALEEVDDRVGEVELVGLVEHVLARELVGDEELGEVTRGGRTSERRRGSKRDSGDSPDDLGRRGDLNDISALCKKNCEKTVFRDCSEGRRTSKFASM